MSTPQKVDGPQTHPAAHVLVCRVAWWFLERAPKAARRTALPDTATDAERARAVIEEQNAAVRHSGHYSQAKGRPFNSGYPTASNAPWHAEENDWSTALELLRRVGWKKAIEAAAGFASLNCRLGRFDVRFSDVLGNIEAYANDGRATLAAHCTHLHDPRTDKTDVTKYPVTAFDRLSLVPSWAGHLQWCVVRADLLPDPMAPYLGEPVPAPTRLADNDAGESVRELVALLRDERWDRQLRELGFVPAPMFWGDSEAANKATSPVSTAPAPTPKASEVLKGLQEIREAVTARTGVVFRSDRRLRDYLKKHGVTPVSVGAKGTKVTLDPSELHRLPAKETPTGGGTSQNR